MTRDEMYRLIEELTAENIRLKADKAQAERRIAQLTEQVDEVQFHVAQLTERVEYLETWGAHALIRQDLIHRN